MKCFSLSIYLGFLFWVAISSVFLHCRAEDFVFRFAVPETEVELEFFCQGQGVRGAMPPLPFASLAEQEVGSKTNPGKGLLCTALICIHIYSLCEKVMCLQCERSRQQSGASCLWLCKAGQENPDPSGAEQMKCL